MTGGQKAARARSSALRAHRFLSHQKSKEQPHAARALLAAQLAVGVHVARILLALSGLRGTHVKRRVGFFRMSDPLENPTMRVLNAFALLRSTTPEHPPQSESRRRSRRLERARRGVSGRARHRVVAAHSFSRTFYFRAQREIGSRKQRSARTHARARENFDLPERHLGHLSRVPSTFLPCALSLSGARRVDRFTVSDTLRNSFWAQGGSRWPRPGTCYAYPRRRRQPLRRGKRPPRTPRAHASL